MENRIVVGNLKTYQTYEDLKEYLEVIDKLNSDRIVLCPTNIFIPYFLNKNIKIGIQDISCKQGKANTGETLASQIKNMGITYAIVGHSERRVNESNEIVNLKVKEALNNNLKVILCIGEKIEQRQETIEVLKKQLKESLQGIEKFDNIIIAYEPIWAIGTNITPTNDEIENTVTEIKKIMNEIFNVDGIEVLYGGSVKDSNIEHLNQINNISGYLVGGSSAKAEELLKIIEVVVNQ